jgi:hypothetical protein
MDGFFTENEWPKLYANAVAMVQTPVNPVPVPDASQSELIPGNGYILTNIILKK